MRPPLSTCRVPLAPQTVALSKTRLGNCTTRVGSRDHAWRWRNGAAPPLSPPPPAPAAKAARSEEPASSAIVPADSATAQPSEPVSTALSRSPRFLPWLRHLEGQLLDLGIAVAKDTTGEDYASDAEEVDEEDEAAARQLELRKKRDMGTAAYENAHIESMRRLGGSLGKMMELIHNDLLPRMPSDPEALFLAASADFISRRWESALRLMQTSLMATADGHCTPKQLAARQYFCALIAIRIVTESDQGVKESGMNLGQLKVGLAQSRVDELCGVIERGLREALRLDPKLHSAYIDSEMLAQIRYPKDAHARVALHAELVQAACETRKYWVCRAQRPMHFYPKLASRPWWEPLDFPWAITLMQKYASRHPTS